MEICKVIASVAILAMLTLTGCQSDVQADKDLSDMAGESGNVTKTDGRSPDLLAELSVDSKNKYITKANDKLGEIATKMSDWKGKVAGLPAATKPMAENSLATLESAHRNATAILGKLKSADVSEWKEQIPDADEAMSEVTTALSKVKSFF